MSRVDPPDGLPSLLDRCRALPRDERAWEEFVQRYDPLAFGLARRVLIRMGMDRNLDNAAADLRMDLWVRLVRDDHAGLRRFKGRSEESLLSYFFRILRNLFIDQIRAEQAERRPKQVRMDPAQFEILLEALADESANPERMVEYTIFREQVVEALRDEWRDRDTRDRDLVICQLAWFERLSAEKIARIHALGLARGGVEKVMLRGLEVLKRRFGRKRELPGEATG